MTMRWLKLKTSEGRQAIVLARSECGALWVELNGVPAALRPSGALWLADAATLVAGDLHLEKGSSFAASGQLLPPYDTRATLLRLEAEINALNPTTVILLGDSFHDERAVGRLSPDDARSLAHIGRRLSLIWGVGNHDEALTVCGRGLPGEILAEIHVAGLTLRHEPQPGLQPGEVSGHLHPCAKVATRGRSVRRRAFLTDGSRLILPAFGAYAGGLNACNPAFFGLFDRAPLAGVMGDGSVHPIRFSSLCSD